MKDSQAILTDELWERVAPLLPQVPISPEGGRPRTSDRECFEGIVWVLRSGARWRDLPDRLPSPPTCWRRHRDWTEAGVWQKCGSWCSPNSKKLGHWTCTNCLSMPRLCRQKKGRRNWQHQAGQGDKDRACHRCQRRSAGSRVGSGKHCRGGLG